jgi:hypothetical protein
VDDLLRIEFEALAGLGLDLDLTGFDPDEIDDIPPTSRGD